MSTLHDSCRMFQIKTNINHLLLFCSSMARMRSNSLKSDAFIGLDNDVISTPRRFAALLILGSAIFPFKKRKKHK